ncbi:MAG TPA: universal stress protein [archaeon]|nr:universal stress protein [archaeon]
MKILLAIDDSKFSEAATNAILEFARPKDTEVRAIYVVEPPAPPVGAQDWGQIPVYVEILKEERARANDVVRQTAETLRAAGLNVSFIVADGSPKTEILQEASNWRADLIVVGSHGRRGLDKFLLGSVSEAVARHARCSVLIVRLPAN